MKFAVIPARGGSKRIPRKNIKSFVGKPMIAYAIEAAQLSGLFDAIYVSTDDAEIAGVAQAYGASVIQRPIDLADDHTPTVPVIAHAIETLMDAGASVQAVCCIYPAVPLIQISDLQQALTQLQAQACDYVFPITSFHSAPQRALMRADDGKLSPLFPAFSSTRTQDLTPAYYDVGQFYWGKKEAWLAHKNIHQHGHGMVIASSRVVDIDTPEDWQRAEALFQIQQNSTQGISYEHTV